MSQMQIDQVLAQIRALSAQASAPGTAAQPAAPSAPDSQFAALLKGGLEQVNQAQQKASALEDAFQRGTPGVDLPQVMVEMQKASISFRALTEVRNRLISAYQEIMQMQL
jgi:flagellar hook-basal body complex protein FliE